MARYLRCVQSVDDSVGRVLDWRQMVAHYPGARQIVLEGSDHALSAFADYLDEVASFCVGASATSGAA